MYMWFSTLVHTDVLDVRCLQFQCSCPVTSRSSPWEGAEAEPLDGTWLSGEIALRHLNRVHLVLDGVHYLLAEQGSSFFDLGSFGFHLQQHHLSQINRVDPLWAFWFWAVGEAASVWGPRPFTLVAELPRLRCCTPKECRSREGPKFWLHVENASANSRWREHRWSGSSSSWWCRLRGISDECHPPTSMAKHTEIRSWYHQRSGVCAEVEVSGGNVAGRTSSPISS